MSQQPSFDDIIGPLQNEFDGPEAEHTAILDAYADACIDLFKIEMQLAASFQDDGISLKDAVTSLDRNKLGNSFFAAWRLVEENK